MSLMKKVSIILIFLAVFSFAFTGSVQAEASFTGVLVEPIVDFSVWLFDGILDTVHLVLLEQETSALRIDLSSTAGEVALAVVGGVVIAAAVAALIVATGGTGGVIAAAAAKIGVAFTAVSAGTVLTGAAIGLVGGAAVIYNAFPDDKIILPVYSITPEEIFLNDLPIFDVDFFNPSGTKTFTTKLGEDIQLDSIAQQLQETISKWYGRLRDIAIVASLSILVYIGIRILLSSTSGDKAKYKQMIMDWIVALCLLFVMQYIMSFSNIIVDNITNLVKETSVNNTYTCIVPYDDKILNYLNKQVEDTGTVYTEDSLGVKTIGGQKAFEWQTNIMGKLRFDVQQTESGTAAYMGGSICFIALVCLTCFFIFTYFKRVLYMAFLTMVAPLVALTYPIDKINDGKAQAFNMWLKEYIFNLLIQPLHLLLYTILISSVFDLAAKNTIYALVAIGFMMPAEKLMRKFFGFEKAQTPGMLNGAAGAAMMMTGMSKLLSKGGKSSKGDSGKKGDSDSDKENTNVRVKDDYNPEDTFAEGLDERTPNPDDPNPDDPNPDDPTEIEYNEPEVDEPVVANPEEHKIETEEPEIEELEEEPKVDEEPEVDEDGYDDRYIEDRIKKKYYDRYVKMNQAIAGGIVGAGRWVGNRRILKGPKKIAKGIKGLPEKSRIAKTASRAMKFYAHGMANKISKKVKNGHLGRKAIKMAGGAFIGGAAAVAAAGIGLASGDPSKMAQGIGTGAAAGYAFGSRMTDKGVEALKVEGVKDKVNETYYGKQKNEERKRAKEIRQRQKDLELRWKLEDKLGSKEKADKYLKDELPKIMEYGDFDNKTIVAMARMQDREKIKTEEAIAAAMMSDQYLGGKDSTRLGDKATSEFEKTLTRRGKERNLSDEKLKAFKEKTKNTINKLDEYRYH